MTRELSRVCSLLGGAQERVIIVSAYLGASALDRLLDAIPGGVTRTAVFARWDIGDLTSGATDWEVWDVAKTHDVPLYACPRLHAKIYVADEVALVGSANATASGLGLDGRGNLELLMPVSVGEPEVSRVLKMVEEEAVEAMPIGADVADQGGDDDGVALFWIPDVSPDRFVDALRGRSPHTDQTRNICFRLRIPEDGSNDALIRRAAQVTTLFRVVKEEFDVRPTPMTVADLRELLSAKVDVRLGQLPAERLAFLVEWMGRFGANTHTGPAPGDSTPTLFPGARLASYDLTD